MENAKYESEPEQHERIYYRHNRTGERAYMVRHEGKDMLRLNRPSEKIYYPVGGGNWVLDKEHRPLNPSQLAQISWVADQQLQRALGIDRRDAAKTRHANSWLDLKDEERIQWMQEGPSGNDTREILYDAITSSLRHLTQ